MNYILACMYWRGVLHTAAIRAKDVPPARTRVHFVGAPPAGLWPGGAYHIDAIGGKYIAFPEARRCGVGIARLGETPLDLLKGLWCGLPGAVQIVPRGELYAIVMVVARLEW